MKVYNPQSQNLINSQLKTLLTNFRIKRNFDPLVYIESKAIVLNSYMKQFGLKSCIVAVSGGIDSAIVLGIIKKAAEIPMSPIEKIIPVSLPVYETKGVTNQKEATDRGKELILALGLAPYCMDLSESYLVLKKEIEANLGVSGEPWAEGQLVPYLRTPTLYYITSLLSQQGLPGIICGTTNKDEGGYLGYFGKASDGMVDVQLISDIHKSEVYQVAKELNIPSSVLNVIPNGDMFDNRKDEEVFGASYDFVELYLYFLCLSKSEQNCFLLKLSDIDLVDFNQLRENLDKMNKYNKHKYLGKSPAVHLDLFQSSIPGGWNNNYVMDEAFLNKGNFVGLFEVEEKLILDNFHSQEKLLKLEKIEINKKDILRIDGFLAQDETKFLLELVQNKNWEAVGFDGIKSNYRIGQKIGSYRASVYSDLLSEFLKKRLINSFQSPKVINSEKTGNKEVWRFCGVSPLFRYIRYEDGSLLIPHYDAPYEYNKNKKTLMSVVIYLKTPTKGGDTRFIQDPQLSLKENTKDFKDWIREANRSEIIYSINPIEGDCLIFDHRLLHDAQMVVGKQNKVIIRTDLIFERCDVDYAK
jgi:NAD+ synthetase